MSPAPLVSQLLAVIFCTLASHCLATAASAKSASAIAVEAHGFMRRAEMGVRTGQSSGAMSGHALSSALSSSVLRHFEADVQRHRMREKAEHAVVTHICADDWVPGALALGASLMKLSMKPDIVIMIGDNVTLPYRNLLSTLFDHIYVQEPVMPHPSITRTGADCVTLQLRSWQLPYKKVLYMDADMVALKSLDSLFTDNGEITAKIDRWKFGWNGGMFMCEPSNTTFSILQKALHTYRGGEKKGIQQYLNHMFPKCNHSNPIPEKHRGLAGCWGYVLQKSHNKFTRELTPTEVQLLTNDSSNGPYDSIHYSGDWAEAVKPWMAGCMAMRDSTTRLQGEARKAVMNLWMRAFREFKAPPGMEKEARIECPLFTCAEKRKSLDYVVVAPDVDCTTKSVVESLLKFAGPRKILVLAPAKACAASGHDLGFGDGVNCIDQDTVHSQVTNATVHGWFRARFGHNMSDALRSQADEYFRQFLKMGIARSAGKYDLSENFVIWDSDAVLLRDFCPFNEDGQANLMEGDDINACDKKEQQTFFGLTGIDYALSDRSQKTFASHHMVVNIHAMSELLSAVGKQRPNADWSLVVLDKACPTAEDCGCGFSTFSSYASWMKHEQPNDVAEVPRQLSPAIKPVHFTGVCCPDSYANFGKHRTEGHLAVTFTRHAGCLDIQAGATAEAPKRAPSLVRRDAIIIPSRVVYKDDVVYRDDA